ncbi:MAG: OB-fold nucleic acid binding domain-containing protein [Pseudomonadota bacterium]
MSNQKNVLVEDFQIDQTIDSEFLVKRKNLYTAKNGKAYLSVNVTDRTGSVDVKVWDNAEMLFELFLENDVIRIEGKVQSFNDKLQLIAKRITRLDPDSVDPTNFLPRSKENIEMIMLKLSKRLQAFENEHLRQLVMSFIGDAEFYKKFSVAPAASSMHHAYLGGLAQHTWELVDFCDVIVDKFSFINRDLLLTGAFLHDSGKVDELEYCHSFNYSTEGKLIGHLIIAIEMINDKIAKIPAFPKELAMQVKHLILSHHGKYEFGSPKLPMTIEGFALSYADDFCAKLVRLKEEIYDKVDQKEWTEFLRMFERSFYAKPWKSDESQSELKAEEAEEKTKNVQKETQSIPDLFE